MNENIHEFIFPSELNLTIFFFIPIACCSTLNFRWIWIQNTRGMSHTVWVLAKFNSCRSMEFNFVEIFWSICDRKVTKIPGNSTKILGNSTKNQTCHPFSISNIANSTDPQCYYEFYLSYFWSLGGIIVTWIPPSDFCISIQLITYLYPE